MKKIVVSLFSIFFLATSYAQTRSTPGNGTGKRDTFIVNKTKPKDSITINKDTINIRGIIYRPDGKPAKNIEIGLLQNEFHPDGYAAITKTDTTGYFELNGAKPYDTLRIVDGKYSGHIFANRGSRFMVIYMPPPKVVDITPDPIEIKSRRKYPKKIPGFRTAIGYPIWDGRGLASLIYPQFIGGNETFINYITQNLVYPPKAISNNIEGTVQIAFTITQDGSIIDVTVIKGIGYGCDEQVINLIRNSAKWRPGIFCGRPFSVQETVSVKFSLIDD
jgi:TonB family protein